MIETDRLRLRPLSVADAEGMTEVLADRQLYNYTGGAPPSPDELRRRYRSWVRGPADPRLQWLNWIVRLDVGDTMIGTVQATIRLEPQPGAEIAWIIGVPWQGNGYASEAVNGLVSWLAGRGVTSLSANIHPNHRASIGVARSAGFDPTDEQVDGEVVWRRQ